MIELELPWPPSVNSYWRTFQGRMIISREGREYRKAVQALLLPLGPAIRQHATERLAVLLQVFPPDRRRRDLDNLGKALLDALAAAGVYEDDSQIDDFHVIRRRVVSGGKVLVAINVMEETTC
ncbi:RusA family crossover junction endodeoxyribonuclease [Tuwongella immobilis]|uniref:Crossover junction endodeoxyribonuclease RusA n=1 Tax=Tuwongella immobilis TaxID=692036 RepID=A0A6C2YXU6_9BACT|nr:RusA family crossover junction endodeoxyribonuclease [Tuwongella immobilis]VIP05585.1 crossover junction endodeoxyribonuclease : Uncharacterized protein OS=Candidatus Paracaedibacter acanthamoebae GN=ID47_03010 PE=4 SV=1: RusA [Tuwongella immobilis]VTS08525.1 crossover junction endodeoxyribonuclease : Uncharacterized protein OS=Candidatus Paracaedibacter acanthamoebae GN=ID47_03010 PE=4 SV=1: RusA [Tuwongella immobilis]